MVQDDSPIPLYLQIEEELRSMIDTGELPPLAKVESESVLASRLGVSRMTARKALDRLVADGLMFRRQGKGTFVSHPKIAHGPSQLLSFSSSMNAQSIRHATRVLAAVVVPAPGRVAHALRLSVGTSVILVRRLRLIDDEPAAIHASWVLNRYSMILQGDLTGSLTELMKSAGGSVAYTNDGIEAALAFGEIAQLLNVPEGSAVVFISGAAYSSDMEPVRYSEAIYRGDRFRFRVDTTGSRNLGLDHGSLRMEPKGNEQLAGLA